MTNLNNQSSLSNLSYLGAKVPYFFYYSTLLELESNGLSVSNLKGFSFCSAFEASLWRNSFKLLSHRNANVFYGMIEEVKTMGRMSEDGVGSETFYVEMSIHATIIGLSLQSCKLSEIVDSVKEFNKDLGGFMDICIKLAESFSNELGYESYEFAVNNFGGFLKAYKSSTFINNIQSNGEKVYLLCKNIKNAKVLDGFFSPFSYLKNSIIGIIKENSEDDEFLVSSFQDCFVWIGPHGNSSLFSYCFLSDKKYNLSLLLESLRLIKMVNQKNTKEAKSSLFRDALASFVLLDNSNSKEELKSVIFNTRNIEYLKTFFYLSGNLDSIKALSYKIKDITKEHFLNFKKDLSTKTQQESYYVLFANIHNSIVNLLLDEKAIQFASFSKESQEKMVEILSGIVFGQIFDRS